MPQEFIVPLLHYMVSVIVDIDTVNIICCNLNKNIENYEVSVELIQTEKVEEDKLPRKCEVYFEDRNGDVVSNELIMVVDSTSDKLDADTYKV